MSSAANSPPWLVSWPSCGSGLAAAPATPPNRPQATALGSRRRSVARAVAANAAASRAIPDQARSLLPIERVDDLVEHHPDACRRCGSLLEVEDPDPLRHQVIEILPITPLVIEHRLHRLV